MEERTSNDARSIVMLPGAAARAPAKQASDVRQPHAASKVRTPPRQTGLHPRSGFLQTTTNPRRLHVVANEQMTNARPARPQAPVRPSFDPALHTADDFLSVTAATFLRARPDSPACFPDIQTVSDACYAERSARQKCLKKS